MGRKSEGQPYRLRTVTTEDRAWVKDFVSERWGAPFVVGHGTIYFPDRLPGLMALDLSGQAAGLVTYHIEDDQCEIITIDTLVGGQGLGTALLAAVNAAARAAGCRRVWLITTNDNLQALAFYQKRGFRLVAIRRGAVQRSREIKPTIPYIGANGIPINDEIELELNLTDQVMD